MYHKFLIVVVLATCAFARPKNFDPYLLGSTSTTNKPVVSAHELEQNRAAHYQFSSNIDDHISDLTHERTETRDGLKVSGMYSYSDGYYKRTVHYEADDKGYRVTGMEAIPLAGPQIDLTGTASVSNAAHGTHLAYKVQSVPIPGPVAKVVDFN